MFPTSASHFYYHHHHHILAHLTKNELDYALNKAFQHSTQTIFIILNHYPKTALITSLLFQCLFWSCECTKPSDLCWDYYTIILWRWYRDVQYIALDLEKNQFYLLLHQSFNKPTTFEVLRDAWFLMKSFTIVREGSEIWRKIVWWGTCSIFESKTGVEILKDIGNFP